MLPPQTGDGLIPCGSCPQAISQTGFPTGEVSIMSRSGLFGLALAAVLGAGSAPALGDPGLTEGFPGTVDIVYDIVRDGAVVGRHRVSFVQDGDSIQVTTDVKIDISLLFVPVYSLRHHAVEIWQDGAMVAFNSTTDDNGRDRVIDIVPENGDWRVEHDGSLDIRPGAALIGSLWHPDTANSTMLIDPIKGKLREVTVTDRGMEEITVPLGTVEARHISIAGDVEQEVWYGPDGHVWQVDFPVKAGGRLTLKRRH